MQRSPRSVVALLVACLVLVGVAAVEHAPDRAPEHTRAGHAPTGVH